MGAWPNRCRISAIDRLSTVRVGRIGGSDARRHHNTGAKGCLSQAAVGHGRVMLRHELDGSWSGRAAEAFNSGPLKTALRRNYPNKRTHKVLEDNDPTGYKSGAGMAAKRACNIDVFEIPCRSPDLNPLDYAIWAEVSKRMRRQEVNWQNKQERRDEYLARLKKTAQGLQRAFVDRVIGNMAVRCERLFGAATSSRAGPPSEGPRQGGLPM